MPRNRMLIAMPVVLGSASFVIALALGAGCSDASPPQGTAVAKSVPVPASKYHPYMRNDFFHITVDLPNGCKFDTSRKPICFYTDATDPTQNGTWEYVKHRNNSKDVTSRVTLVFLARKPGNHKERSKWGLDGLGTGSVNITVPITPSSGTSDTSATIYPVDEVTES